MIVPFSMSRSRLRVQYNLKIARLTSNSFFRHYPFQLKIFKLFFDLYVEPLRNQECIVPSVPLGTAILLRNVIASPTGSANGRPWLNIFSRASDSQSESMVSYWTDRFDGTGRATGSAGRFERFTWFLIVCGGGGLAWATQRTQFATASRLQSVFVRI